MGYVSIPPDATIDSKIAVHTALAQNVHGVGANDVQGANDMTAHAALTQNVHGAGAYDIQDSNDMSVHAALSQSVHGAGAYDIQDANDLAGYSKISSGTYTGNNSQNRAIPHGLGVKPKYVHAIGKTTPSSYSMDYDLTQCLLYSGTASVMLFTVTDADATNFYVGKVTSFFGNASTVVYNWAAIG